MDTSSFTRFSLCWGSARSIPYPLPPGERQGEGRCERASLVFGLGVGNLITLPPLLAREEFGQRSFGTVFGHVAATAQVGVALGPGLMGVLHDALGSYRPVL